MQAQGLLSVLFTLYPPYLGQCLVQGKHSIDSRCIFRWHNRNAWGSGKGRRGRGGPNALVLELVSVGSLFSEAT